MRSLLRLPSSGPAAGLAFAAAVLLPFAASTQRVSAQLDALGGEEAIVDAAEQVTNLEIDSNNTTFDETLGIARAMGNVNIRYGNVVIECEEAEFHQSSGKVFAREEVTVYKDGQIFRGQEIIYDTNTGEMTATELRSALEPLYYQAGQLTVPTDATDMIEMGDSFFTTHDAENPNFSIHAKKMRIYPGDKVTMNGVKFYADDKPIFWLPYLSQPLDDELGYYFVPGFSSPWGAFLLNRYGFMIGEHTLAAAHLDFRSERGIAGGIELKSERHRSKEHYGRLFVYGASDNNPQESYTGRTRLREIDSSRYRVNFQHRVYLPGPDESTLYLDVDINKLSDEFFYEDFFPAEYRDDPQPDNILNLVKRAPWGTVSLTGRFQLNDFFQTDERLPELAADFTRTPLFDSGFFYNGYTTWGIIEEDLADIDRDARTAEQDLRAGYLSGLERGAFSIVGGDLVDTATGELVAADFDPATETTLLEEMERMLDPRGYNRFDTYHEVVYPGQIGNWLNIIPRGGIGYTNYASIDAPDIGSFSRTTGHAGVEASFKMSKRYPDAINRSLGLDGVMHVLQPYTNFSFVGTDDIGARFTPIDRITPTTRLRPIDLPLYTPVDSLNDWQILRTGFNNEWLTRRNGGTHQWLSINTYFDTYFEDPEFNRDFSNLFNDIAWRPLPWLTARVDSQVPVFNQDLDFTEVTSSLTFMPKDWFEFTIGHFYLDDHPFFRDSNLVSLGTYTRLSDQWGFSTQHRFEAQDSTLEIQQYQLHRDLESWTASIGGIIRDNRVGDEEYGILLSLTLKAFPKITVPLDLEPGNTE